MSVRVQPFAWLAATLVLVGACSAPTAGTTAATPASAERGASELGVDPSRWPDVLAAAKGQIVNWYRWGGEEGLNSYVTGWVSAERRPWGVTINQVKITDTVDAVNKILAEKQAGRATDGSVDLVWVNGENFATGVQAHLWSCGCPSRLPNAWYIDLSDPAIASDFGRPVQDCEATWNATTSALVYNSAHVRSADVASLPAFEQWVRAHPGRFTYPAPPDFTDSMVVRTFAYDEAGSGRP